MFERILKIKASKLQSFFFWGARQTGKSWYLKAQYSASFYVDLLETENVIRYTKAPYLLKEEILAQSAEKLKQPIIIDEIQKVPELLNEVHWLIENKKLSFVLCGSSARKLKTQATNLLGGRAWIYHFYPLTYPEIPAFDLLRALHNGLLPKHYQSNKQDIAQHCKAYVDIYLTEEIRNEGLVRNLTGFARFLDVVGLCHGEMINASNIARDCHIDRSAVQGYFQILIDTMLGYFIYPYHKKKKRDLIVATPKFYLFDVGIANYLAAREVTQLKGDAAGRSFEHYILMELIAYRDYFQKRFDITYWRTKQGLEVDFVLGDARIAIEVKISTQVHQSDLQGLLAFCEEHPKTIAIVVSQDKAPRKLMIDHKKTITILPWRDFLTQLWVDHLI